jgi:hypothetical protein
MDTKKRNMIQQDFRIGNYVKYVDGRIGTIEAGIGSSKIRVKLEHSSLTTPPELLEPVYLSNEILSKYAELVNKVSGTFRIDLPTRNEVLFLSLKEVGNSKPYYVDLFSFGTSKRIRLVHYLHDIQNIVYCLTSNELQPVSNK